MPVRFPSLLANRNLSAHVVAERIITPIRPQARIVRRIRATVQSWHLLRRDRWTPWRVTLQNLAVRGRPGRAIRGSDAQRTPDLLYAAAAQREYSAPRHGRYRRRSDLSSTPFPYQSLVAELLQLGRQSSLQSDDRFLTVAKAVIGGKQLAGEAARRQI